MTAKLARVNLAIRGIDPNLGPRNADTFHANLHPDLKADFTLANGKGRPLLTRLLQGQVNFEKN